MGQTSSNNKRPRSPQSWLHMFAKSIIEKFLNIWHKRNQEIHGKSMEETRKKSREATLGRVKEIYRNPPRLATRFLSVTLMPMDQRINCTTQKLED